MEDRSSAFLSLVEPVGGALPDTVNRVNHQRAGEFAPVRQIAGEPRWLQVIHERNLSSKMRGTPHDGLDLETSFGVKPS